VRYLLPACSAFLAHSSQPHQETHAAGVA